MNPFHGADYPLSIDSTSENIKSNYDSNSFEVASNSLKLNLGSNSGLNIDTTTGYEGLKINLESGTPLYINSSYNQLTFQIDGNHLEFFSYPSGGHGLRINILLNGGLQIFAGGSGISTTYKNELTTLKDQAQAAKTGADASKAAAQTSATAAESSATAAATSATECTAAATEATGAATTATAAAVESTASSAVSSAAAGESSTAAAISTGAAVAAAASANAARK